MKIPKEIEGSRYLQSRLPKISIDEILDVHKKINKMTAKKFWELFDNCTNIRSNKMGNQSSDTFSKGNHTSPQIADDSNIGYDYTSDNVIKPPKDLDIGFTVPISSNMIWECNYCGWRFVASWSPVDKEAYGFPNPLCPHCGRWEEVIFIFNI